MPFFLDGEKEKQIIESQKCPCCGGHAIIYTAKSMSKMMKEKGRIVCFICGKAKVELIPIGFT